ncbi:DNA methyltransferase [Neptuniibacter sp.]|uniref:class I SAM-dependent DNA methyltransferase n=1 Tax=Neptuniibacter sp. TaxID=1962643 RepID=UPI00261A7F56|nr:DNA methyltransferase [Neptuniibacter sp.]MCP4597872.1 class I SAM-dependent DNA methyltransferase [Neptuniibacter sp.]
MNAVEIEEAISQLAEQPFDADNFPYAFLEAFGNKATTIKRLKSGSTNSSDIDRGVLQRNNVHIAVCEHGEVSETLEKLKCSPATVKGKVKFVVATDGESFEAEDLTSDEAPVICSYKEFPDHFGYFLSLAGITTVKQIRESSFDIKATGRLNRLYVELLKDNPEWGTAERRHDMNHFMARLIFCFFAEDTDIFDGTGLFTKTIEQMSERDSSNTHEVMSIVFQAMDTSIADRVNSKFPRWADLFPYVNGGLFAGNTDVPRFSKIARSYLIHIGNLDWTKINPDIFGSMIQAVTDEEERGALGLHYTSVPNILKVLNPLFLDDLRVSLEEAGNNARMLLNLRKRMSKIRVFDPACGSGNFLVIAYKEMRDIEAEINKRRGEKDRKTDIPLTNFRGIELREFPAEIARLALIIAEYQCDVHYRGQQEALAEFLPLDAMNWIICGNALRLDWQSVCPPTGSGVKLHANDLFDTPLDQAEIDFENEGGETYICGNPPYKGSQTQSKEQKSDLALVFDEMNISSKQIDYVGGWFMKAAKYSKKSKADIAFVSTNSVCQGRIVPLLWPKIFELGVSISFAHTSFKWANLASHNAGVMVAIVGLTRSEEKKRFLYELNDQGETVSRSAKNITPYLTSGTNVIVDAQRKSISGLMNMSFGNMPVDGGNLLLSDVDLKEMNLSVEQKKSFIRRIYGSAEFIRGKTRYCIWIDDDAVDEALEVDTIRKRVDAVKTMRLASKDSGTREMALRPHQFREMNEAQSHTLILPGVSSENREYLPVGIIDQKSAVTNLAFAIFDAPLWCMSLIASKLHLIWVATVCGKLKTDYRYSNTLGWNTFPVIKLTEKNKEDLTRCAQDILLAREVHFPETIADLYDPEKMPENLRRAHERNDEVLERIYIGRRFKNDTERLEKLFELYTKMTKTDNKTKDA